MAISIHEYQNYPDPLDVEEIFRETFDAISCAFDDADVAAIKNAVSGKKHFSGGFCGAFYDDLEQGSSEVVTYVLDDTGDECIREGVLLTDTGQSVHFYGTGHLAEGISISSLHVFPVGTFDRLCESVEEKVFRQMLTRSLEMMEVLSPERQIEIIESVIMARPALKAVKEAKALAEAAQSVGDDFALRGLGNRSPRRF